MPGNQRAVHDQVGIAPDRRCEMRIRPQSQPEMPKIFREIIRLRHRPQRGDVHQLAKISIFGLRQQPVQMRCLQHLPLGKRKPRCLGHFAQRVQLFGARFFMHPEQQRPLQAHQFFGSRHIGQHHEFLDQAVRVQPFGESHRLHRARIIQHDLAFRQVKFQRPPRRPRQFKRRVGRINRRNHTVQQRRGFVIRPAIHRILHLRIMQTRLRPHQTPHKPVADLVPLRVDHHLHRQTGPVHMFVKRAQITRQRIRQHWHHPVGEIG